MTKLDPELAADRKAKQIIKNTPKYSPDNFRFNEKLKSEFVTKHASGCSESFIWSYNTFSVIFSDLYKQLNELAIHRFDSDAVRLECAAIALNDSMIVVGRTYEQRSQLVNKKKNLYVMADTPFISLSDGNKYSPDDIFAGLIDSLKAMLDYIGYSENTHGSGPEKPDIETIKEFFQLTNMYIIVKNDWQEALWHREHIAPLDGQVPFNPLRHLRAIGLYRSTLAGLQGDLYLAGRAELNHPVIILSQKQDFRKFKLRRFLKDQLLAIRSTKYGEKISDEIFNRRDGINLHHLVAAYILLEAICRANVDKIVMKRRTEDLMDYFSFQLSDVISYLTSITGSDEAHIKAVLEALTFKEGGKEELWHQPLLVIGGTAIILFPIFMYGNLERFLSRACIRLGIDLSKFGKVFERGVRSEFAKYVKASALSDSIHICNTSKFESGSNYEEIDLIFSLNGHVFLAEVKSDFFAADAVSFGDHVSKIEDAVSQAVRKADFVQRDLALFSDKYFKGAPLRAVFPFVITEQRHLSGAVIGECPVIDLTSLVKFFDRTLMFNVTQSPTGAIRAGKTVTTFEDKTKAHDDLCRYMTSNPFVDNIGLHAVLTSLPRSGSRFKVEYIRADVRIDPRKQFM